MKGMLIETAYELVYSVPSLGAMTTPTDMITLTWTTGSAICCDKFRFTALGDVGNRLRLIEAPTGGGASPTGVLTPLNKDRTAETSAVAAFYYDATLATGGVTLVDEYLTTGLGAVTIGGGPMKRRHTILKLDTLYQLSLYGTGTNPATLIMNWREMCAGC